MDKTRDPAAPLTTDQRVNDSRVPDPRKDICDELAALLATDPGRRTARWLQQILGDSWTPAETSAEPAETALADRRAHPISIWQPQEQDGELVFVRPEPLPLGDHYASCRCLRARKPAGTQRLLWLGESVAAGYLYAPHWTPAGVLQTQLAALSGPALTGPAAWEVIDLARTNERLGSLVQTLRTARQLQPDVLVLFVGNHWNLLETPEFSPYAPSVRARQNLALKLAQSGIQSGIAAAQQRLQQRADQAFNEVAAIAQETPSEVVLVVPEVNLADWENRQPVTWLAGDGTARWYALERRAETALAAADWDALHDLAERMIALDRGTCPTSWRLLALAAHGHGRVAAAEHACRQEITASHYLSNCFLGAPQAAPWVQDFLRQTATRHGWHCVDLPQMFAAAARSPWGADVRDDGLIKAQDAQEMELPGRRFFLDYCHLTHGGMRVATAGVSAAVLGRTHWTDVLAALPPAAQAAPPPEVEALAQLGGAIHMAHRLVSVRAKRSLLIPGCRAALAASPGVADAVRELLIARLAPLPAVLTAAQASNFDSPYRLLLQHGWRWEFLDLDLLDALGEALTGVQASFAGEFTERLLADHAVDAKGRELTSPPYLWEPLERFYPDAMVPANRSERAIHRAPWPETSWALVFDGSADLELELTVRIPQIPGLAHPRSRRLRLRVNGQACGSWRVGGTWQKVRVELSRNVCRRGLNRLTLHWPLPVAGGERALAAAVERLAQGLEADLHPVFGEVFSCRARLLPHALEVPAD